MLRNLSGVPWRLAPVAPALGTLAESHVYTLGLVALTLAGFGLRLLLLDRFPLREDEAIYASWALHFLRDDPFFLQVWPDKPPLFLWLLGGVFAAAGPGEATARWLNIAAAALTIPAVAAGGRRLWGSPAAGLAAGALLALNPFALSFAATVYTDPLLVLLGTLAIVQALRGRPGWAGAWLGAALMTKQQGVLYIPLVAALVWIPPMPRHDPAWCTAPQRLGIWLASVAVVVLPVVVWDSLRWAVAPSPWDLATRNYQPLTLAPPATWAVRVEEWAALAWYLGASWVVWAVAGLALALAFMVSLARWGNSSPRNLGVHNRAALLIGGWGIAYLFLHVLATVQTWDRYLLPLAPLWAWGLAWPVAVACRPRLPAGSPTRWLRLGHSLPPLLLVGALCLLSPALAAAQGRFPIGGDHGDYTGLHPALVWVEAQPGRQVLYHRSLGWHYRFYLDDRVRQGVTDLRWFPTATYLADNAAKTPYPRRFLILPDWAPLPDLPLHLATRGLALQVQLKTGRFTVYEITHHPQAACDWCWCGPRLVLTPAVPAAPVWTAKP